ncbi:MAG: tetratricopeptide repeat protein [Bacteroidales bacterium]
MKKILLSILFFLFSLISLAQLNVNYYLSVGRGKLYAQKYNEAIDAFNVVINVKPKLADPYFLRGIAKFNLTDYLGAEQDFAKAIELKPNHTAALKNRGITRVNLKKYYLALNDFNQAIKLYAIDPELYVYRGLCYININHYQQAIKDFNQSLEITKQNKKAYFYRGLAKHYSEDTLGALDDYNKALTIDPEYIPVYMNKGILYSDWEKYDSAKTCFSRVIKIDPLNASAYINRSLVNYYQEKTKTAVHDLDTAIQIEPDNSLALFNRALLKNELELKRDAISDLDKVIQLNPQNILSYFNRGLIKQEIDDLQGAFIDFSKAIEIYPDFAKAYISRSNVRQQLDDIQGALADRQRAENIIAAVRENKESYASYTDTSDNFRNLITLKSSNRFYNHPNYNQRIEPEENYALTTGDQNSEYFLKIAALNDNMEEHKNSYAELGLVIINENEDMMSIDSLKMKVAALEKNYKSSPNKYQNLIVTAIYKSYLKNFNGALSDLDLAIKLKPDYFLAYFCRGNIRSEMIDYIKLLDQENDVLLIDPQQQSNIKTIKEQESYTDYQYVINDYLKAIDLSPGFIFSGFNLANTYLKTRDYKKAITWYNKVIRSDNTFAEAYYNRGLTYIYLKQNENGCMDMSKSGELGIQNAYVVIGRFCEN